MPVWDHAKTIALSDTLRVNMVVIDGNLGLQVQVKGVQVLSVVLLDAARDISPERLRQYRAVAPELSFQVGNALDHIEPLRPQ
jgi:hypothetical protein